MSHHDKNKPNIPPVASSHDIDLVYMAGLSVFNINKERTVVEPAREAAGWLKQTVEVPYQDGHMKIWRFQQPDAYDPTRLNESDARTPTDTPLAIEVYDKTGKRTHDYLVEDGRADQDADGISVGSEAIDQELDPSDPHYHMSKLAAKTLLTHMTEEIPYRLSPERN